MKKKYILSQFILILCFFVIPSFFTPAHSITEELEKVQVTLNIIIRFFVALLLEFQIYFLYKTKKIQKPKTSFFSILVNAPLTMGLLMLSAAFLTFLSLTPFFKDSISQTSQIFAKPENFIEWLSAIFCFLMAAFFEEAVFRHFIPESIHFLFQKNYSWNTTPVLKELNLSQKTFFILRELAANIIFSLCHIYLGPFAVVNSFICGIILRRCFIKTKSVWTGTGVHFLYNLIILIFQIA